ncbi:hypothetical protein [Xanthobacter autotrophicus]|uniref:hypothetical protein n=1 Tax=Xanthobacter autotrophicus TaxID=280 RepID=UPI003729BB34
MSWTSKAKALSVTDVKPHVSSATGAVGRRPSVSTIHFSPFALFGAAAKCSWTHVVNASIATPESDVVKFLLQQHVDDLKSDFAIEPSADTMKDFVKSYFAGTVAQGLAYLTMIQDGYIWTDHFENLAGAGGKGKKPDFVFAGHGTGAALMEAKGSRSAALTAFDSTVAQGYDQQIDPHLGRSIGGVTVTHGYCIGSHLQSTTKAELRIHHTATPVMPASGTDDPEGAVATISAIQRGNYATALTLVHGAEVGMAFRNGETPRRVEFLRFSWRGRMWLTSRIIRPDGTQFLIDDRSDAIFRLPQPYTFAIEEGTARIAFAYFLGDGDAYSWADLPFIRPEVIDPTGDGEEGAIFPDGFAVIGPDARIELEGSLVWTPDGDGTGHWRADVAKAETAVQWVLNRPLKLLRQKQSKAVEEESTPEQQAIWTENEF